MDERRLPAFLLALIAILVVAAPAFAHVERPSYWPDPAPDTSVKPAAGGKVPKIRTLRSSLNKKLPGKTRVVCQPSSLKQLRIAVKAAVKNGYFIRPTDHRNYNKAQGKRLIAINKKLFKLCKYREIQPAVTASGNNDRVVIMPGLYTEPTSRAQPTHDERCKDLKTDGDHPGEENGAFTYKGEFTCPNDANLIAVMGREPGPNPPPKPPNWDRHGIPDPTTLSSRPATPRRATAARTGPGTRRTSASAPTAPTGSCCAT
jgi:hypothetical protein